MVKKSPFLELKLPIVWRKTDELRLGSPPTSGRWMWWAFANHWTWTLGCQGGPCGMVVPWGCWKWICTPRIGVLSCFAPNDICGHPGRLFLGLYPCVCAGSLQSVPGIYSCPRFGIWPSLNAVSYTLPYESIAWNCFHSTRWFLVSFLTINIH